MNTDQIISHIRAALKQDLPICCCFSSCSTPLDFCLKATSSRKFSLTTFYQYQPSFSSTLFTPFALFYVFFPLNCVFHHLPYLTFICLFVSPPSPIKNVISPRALFSFLLCPQHLEQCLGHIRHLISKCYMNKLGSE